MGPTQLPRHSVLWDRRRVCLNFRLHAAALFCRYIHRYCSCCTHNLYTRVYIHTFYIRYVGIFTDQHMAHSTPTTLFFDVYTNIFVYTCVCYNGTRFHIRCTLYSKYPKTILFSLFHLRRGRAHTHKLRFPDSCSPMSTLILRLYATSRTHGTAHVCITVKSVNAAVCVWRKF